MWRRGAFSGAEPLLTRCADVIAGHTVCSNEAERVRDMREYPLWARALRIVLNQRPPLRPERYCAIARPEGARHQIKASVALSIGFGQDVLIGAEHRSAVFFDCRYQTNDSSAQTESS